MKRLYVGCRVRFVEARTFYGEPYVGSEARIVERDCDSYHPVTLEIEKSDFLIRLSTGEQLAVMAEQIEPIVDDLNKKIEWADMADLWTPSGVEA